MKPTFFISSTIFDFKDMRSAIKWWLEDNQYKVNASEYNDFDKPVGDNSYESCLKAIDNSDYFILLIGDRFGGMYDDTISITQMEYRHAYQRMQQGKLKIINFVRQDTLTKADEYKNQIRGTKIDIAALNKADKEKHNIFLFIQEVRRVEDMKNDLRPKNNWLHQFNGFPDVLNALNIELGDKIGLNYKSKRFMIGQNLMDNIRLLMINRQDYGVMTRGFINEKLFKSFKLDLDVATIQLTKPQQINLGIFYISYLQVSKLKTLPIEKFYNEGFFIEFDKEINDYASKDLNELASAVLGSYQAYNSLHSSLYASSADVIAKLAKKANGELPIVNTTLIFNAIRLYDIILNCIDSSKNLYKALWHMEYVIPEHRLSLEVYPEDSLADESESITEEQVLNYLKS
ncbi:MAG: DUF4062 domain-containing protein [Sphingobacteriaceae bacterium]|nr:MAG: DUF4062 domain-containing protein [Sphingobacteriaceae bacterium]